MKKTLAVLVLSGVCAALLFAQDLGARPQPPAAPQIASEPQMELVEPAPVIPVVKPVPVEMPADVVETVISPAIVIPEIAETDEIGITDDMTAGAELIGGRISLTLKGVELREVVGLFSRLSNANIIVPDLGEEIEAKRIDMNLDNVEWKPALQAILDTNGLELYEKIPSTEVYSIRPREAGRPEPLEIRVFKLKYATVSEITNLVSSVLGGGGSNVSTYPARNSIVVQGTAKMLSDVGGIIQLIDLPREQVFIEAKFLELTDSASKQLGIDWQVLGGYGAGLSGLGGNYKYDESRADNVNRFSGISGKPYEELTAASDTVEWIEDPNHPGTYQLFDGIDFDARPGNNPDLLRIFGVTPTVESLDSALVNKALTATLNVDDFNLVLAALKDVQGASVVSNPKIIVANEEQAEIHLGTQEPNIRIQRQRGTSDDPGGSLTVELDPSTPYFEDGVKVVVTPTINTSSNISVIIEPELTSFIGRKKVEQDGYTLIDYPISSTKRVRTVFSLESGQTAAIGGLTRLEEKDIDRKIPVLGDLPVIGRFFSYKSTSKANSETVIFVTVGLANPANINMETGLPDNSVLAMRHQASAKTDRAIHAEELKILETMEAERLQERMGALRSSEENRLKKEEK